MIKLVEADYRNALLLEVNNMNRFRRVPGVTRDKVSLLGASDAAFCNREWDDMPDIHIKRNLLGEWILELGDCRVDFENNTVFPVGVAGEPRCIGVCSYAEVLKVLKEVYITVRPKEKK